MTAKKMWMELSPATRTKRFERMANNHLPKGRTVLPVSVAHRKCRDGALCTGPGCVYSRGK